MKIELKNTSFKNLYEWLVKSNNFNLTLPTDVQSILINELKPQYEDYFEKYKNEKQEFQIGDKVIFNRWDKSFIGKISKISRRSNGKYYYIIKYTDHDYCGSYKTFTNPLTKKNITKTNYK